jgi:hypothetical protein
MSEHSTGTRQPVSGFKDDEIAAVPSWVVGICGVAAVASALFSILLFLNR